MTDEQSGHGNSLEGKPEGAPEPSPIQVVIDAEGLLNHARSEEVQALTNEWLELELRLEMLQDQKDEFLASWRKDKAKAVKRVREIRNELGAIRNGSSEPRDDSEGEQKPTPTQLGLYDGGDQ